MGCVYYFLSFHFGSVVIFSSCFYSIFIFLLHLAIRFLFIGVSGVSWTARRTEEYIDNLHIMYTTLHVILNSSSNLSFSFPF
jgi:hypothetical protein